jgi:outer membrane protein TolC
MTIDVASRARVAFYQAAAAEQLRSLRRSIAEAAAASAALAHSLHEAGNLTDFDLAREAVFDEESRLDARHAETGATSARERLNAVLGLHGEETGWRLVATLDDAPAGQPEVADLEREAVAASLELEATRWSIEAAGQRIGAARLESWLPDLGIGVSAKQETEWGVGPVVTLSIPIFDWGQGKRAAAWAGLRVAQHEYTDVAVKLRAAARAARERVAAAHERATRIQSVVMPLRERLLDEALLQYNAMNLSPFELLILRREHIEAEERYIDALLDYWVARTEVEQLRAGSLPRGETRNPQGEE